MANTNSPFGFRWHGLGGDAVTPSSGLFVGRIASGNATAFGEGDPLMRVSTGYITAWGYGYGVTTSMIGVFKSCEYYSTSQGRKVYKNYWPGSDATGDVLVHIEQAYGSVTPRFLVQSSGASAVTLSSVGMNTDIATGTSKGGTVTSGYYRSVCTIDALANFATTSTLPFRIVDLYSNYAPSTSAPGADLTTQYNWVLVEANPGFFSGI